MNWRRTLAASVPEQVKSPLRDLFGRPHPFGVALADRNRLGVMPRNQPTRVDLFGVEIQVVDAASFLASHREIFCDGIYEFNDTGAPLHILDVGANIGLATIYLKRRFPTACVTAIESDPQVASVLRHNLQSFGLHDVAVLEAAAWNCEGVVQFSSNKADAGRVSQDGDRPVRAIRLADLIGESRWDFIKMDIEGAEESVLLDCEPVLNNVKRMFIEYHADASHPQRLSELLRVIEGAGFRYYIERTGVYSHRPLNRLDQESGFDLQLNIFATRGDQR